MTTAEYTGAIIAILTLLGGGVGAWSSMKEKIATISGLIVAKTTKIEELATSTIAQSIIINAYNLKMVTYELEIKQLQKDNSKFDGTVEKIFNSLEEIKTSLNNKIDKNDTHEFSHIGK